MKRPHRHALHSRPLVWMAAIWLTISQAMGSVVVNTNVYLDEVEDPGNFLPWDYGLSVAISRNGEDITSVFLSLENSMLTLESYLLVGGIELYLAEELDRFTRQTIDRNDFTVLLEHEPVLQMNTIDVGTGDFYLGINAGIDSENGGNSSKRSLFGWVKLRNASGQLTLVESAMAYEGDGIIIGTTECIPEPAAYALLLGALALLAPLVRRARFLKERF